MLVRLSSWTIDGLKARHKQPRTAAPQYLFFLNNEDTPEHFSLMNWKTGYMVLSDGPIIRGHIVDGLSVYQIHVHDLLDWANAIGRSVPPEAPATARLGTFYSTLVDSRLTTLDPMEQSRQLLAIFLLRAQGQPSDIPLVARFLSHPNVEHRHKAVSLIRELMTSWPKPPNPRAKKYLIQALYDPDPATFSSALHGLNDFKDPDMHLSLQRAAHYWSQRPWGLEHVRQICYELDRPQRPTLQECINARSAVHNPPSTARPFHHKTTAAPSAGDS